MASGAEIMTYGAGWGPNAALIGLPIGDGTWRPKRPSSFGVTAAK